MLMDHCHIVIALHILKYIILSLYFLAQDHSVKTMHVDPRDRPCRPKQYRNNMRGTDHKATQRSVNGAETLTREAQGAVSNPVSSDVTAPTSDSSYNTHASASTDEVLSTMRSADTSAGQLRRLRNPGALCFANASMQALAAVPQVWSAVESVRRRTAESWNAWFFDKRGSEKQRCNTREPNFDALISAIFEHASGNKDEDPVQLDMLNKVFYTGKQEDAHEFLMELTNTDCAPKIADVFAIHTQTKLQCLAEYCDGQLIRDASKETCMG